MIRLTEVNVSIVFFNDNSGKNWDGSSRQNPTAHDSGVPWPHTNIRVCFQFRISYISCLTYTEISHWYHLVICLLRLKEFIKEQLITVPTASRPPVASQPQPVSPPIAASDPGALLAGLLWKTCQQNFNEYLYKFMVTIRKEKKETLELSYNPMG